MSGTAERRKHTARLKRARRKYWGQDLAGQPRLLAKAITCPKVCSCVTCGNQRKYEGPTLQERRSALALTEES